VARHRTVAAHGAGPAERTGCELIAAAPASAPPTPLEPLFDAASFLNGPHDTTRPRGRGLAAYYAVKPLIPRWLQLAMRRAYARRSADTAFPAWPREDVLIRLQMERFRAEMERRASDRIPFINFWPDGKRFAFVLTHDVEGPKGLELIEPLIEIEQRYGFVSAWFVVAEDYEIPAGTFERIRAAGGEVGVHGLTHSGTLFRDRATFEAQLPQIHRYISEWGAAGFRSPATHRNAAWMPELGCLYDSSFPDTDPFEPQAGGCCSILPFFIRDLIELPITMVQDHTLFEILREDSAERWINKADWIAENRGLVNVLVHPDYATSPRRLELYEQLLEHLSKRIDGWHALPREVAAWWRLRSTIERNLAGRAPVWLPERATVAHAVSRGDEIWIEA
jgi:hypothetical protein